VIAKTEEAVEAVTAHCASGVSSSNNDGKWQGKQNNQQSTGGSHGDSMWCTGNSTGKQAVTAAMVDGADVADAQWFYFDGWGAGRGSSGDNFLMAASLTMGCGLRGGGG